jgi:hypothetical protein
MIDLLFCHDNRILNFHPNVCELPNYMSLKSKSHLRSEVFVAVTMNNAVFWDIKTKFIPHTRHFTSSLQNRAVNVM